MLGSKNRDYKTSARSALNNCKKHIELMKKYIESGMTAEQASKKAYKDIIEN